MKKKIFALCLVELLSASSAFAALPSMPTSGSCGLMMTLPVPYLGNNVNGGTGPVSNTGYGFIGEINFTSSSTATMTASIVNATYGASGTNSPQISSTMNFTNAAVTIASNGYGGYTLTTSGTISGTSNTFGFTLIAVPTNNGNTLLLQAGGNPSSGFGPGSGVCQF